MDHMFPVIPRLLCLYQYKLEICDFIVIEKWISVILKAWNSNESNNNAVMMFNVHCRQFSKAINFLSSHYNYAIWHIQERRNNCTEYNLAFYPQVFQN